MGMCFCIAGWPESPGRVVRSMLQISLTILSGGDGPGGIRERMCRGKGPNFELELDERAGGAMLMRAQGGEGDVGGPAEIEAAADKRDVELLGGNGVELEVEIRGAVGDFAVRSKPGAGGGETGSEGWEEARHRERGCGLKEKRSGRVLRHGGCFLSRSRCLDRAR